MSEAKKTGLSHPRRREDMRRTAGEAPAKRSKDDVHWFPHVDSQRSSIAKKVRGLRIFAATVSVEVEPSFQEQDLISDTILDVITGRHDSQRRGHAEGDSVSA